MPWYATHLYRCKRSKTVESKYDFFENKIDRLKVNQLEAVPVIVDEPVLLHIG